MLKKTYSQTQYWNLFRKLPGELKNQILSEETAKNIFDTCERNKIDIDQVSTIASHVGLVLLGILPPTEFQKTLEKEVKLKKDTAKRVAHEINRFIFYPVKASLEELYKIEITPPAKMKVTPPPEEKPPTPAGEDKYREEVE